MAAPRKLKKSESLEIRIPHPTKEAFMARCRDEGRSASETLRAFIEGRLEPAAPRSFLERRGRQLAVGALIAAAMGAVALPSIARPGPEPSFRQLDLNADGRITRDELARIDANRDGAISYAEALASR
jgi:hypothetical protein